MMWSNPIRILKANEREQKDKSIQVVIKHRKKEKKKSSSPSSVMASSLMCHLAWPCHFNSGVPLSTQTGEPADDLEVLARGCPAGLGSGGGSGVDTL